MQTLSGNKIAGLSGARGRLCAVLFFFGLTAVVPFSSAFDGQVSPVGEAAATDTANTALRALLDSAMLPDLSWPRVSDHQLDLKRLYQNRNGALLWTVEGKLTQPAAAAAESLGDADKKGLRASDYEVPLLERWLNQLRVGVHPTPRQLALFDVTLSLSLMRYLSSLHGGRVSPYPTQADASVSARPFDVVEIVEKMARGGDIGHMTASVEPPFRMYSDLQRALARYRELAADSRYVPVTLTGVLHPGKHQAGVPDLRRLLRTFSDLPAEASPPANPEIYDDQLVGAVKRFQKRHGLVVDGIVGKATMGQLTIPIGRRIEQIQLGLERFRWLPNRIEGPLLIANIPSFDLYAFRATGRIDEPEVVMKVIVGKAEKGLRSPEFQADMKYIIFRPYWNVPPSITRNEIVPILRRNPAYLSKRGMEIVNRFGGTAKRFSLNKNTMARLNSGTLKIRQKPGPRNSLGRVKFLFPNSYSVYMHDTPAKGLFRRARRDFSHGCIRVEDPVRLAEFALHDQPGWSKKRIEKAMRGSKSKRVNLRVHIPVYVFYSTVLVDPQGNIRFFDDIYGRDAILRQRLANGYPYPW